MYFVDRKKLDETLIYMDALLAELDRAAFTSTIEKIALERITHMLIESVIDVGNMMIDGFIMRDPGGYEDIIDILVDEKVIPKEQEGIYKDFISLRKTIVTDYIQINHVDLEEKMMKYT